MYTFLTLAHWLVYLHLNLILKVCLELNFREIYFLSNTIFFLISMLPFFVCLVNFKVLLEVAFYLFFYKKKCICVVSVRGASYSGSATVLQSVSCRGWTYNSGESVTRVCRASLETRTSSVLLTLTFLVFSLLSLSLFDQRYTLHSMSLIWLHVF